MTAIVQLQNSPSGVIVALAHVAYLASTNRRIIIVIIIIIIIIIITIIIIIIFIIIIIIIFHALPSQRRVMAVANS